MERIKLDMLDDKAMYFLKKLEANKILHIVSTDGDAIKNNEVRSSGAYSPGRRHRPK
jgi:hypothetical protein